ncbi:MAG: AAA family ATPase [Flavobacteriales bacterium]|nr:AAA family ATPase [Flavobacteriales bacterium]
MIIGRNHEQQIFDNCIQSTESQFIAVYGRRRVGKTYLIRNYFGKNMVFQFTGLHEADTPTQLGQFTLELQKYAGNKETISPQKNWLSAMHTLKMLIEKSKSTQKKVIFFDELPWIATARSGFLSALENFWNTWASSRTDIILVVCGSAASWMIKNIVNNKGGLHNRINKKIRLMPFTLAETEAYLKWKQIKLDRYQICQLYMAIGGIPFYLKEVPKGKSAMQIIDDLCFAKDGLLADEYNKLYESLFANSSYHKNIIEELCSKNKGLTRQQLIDNSDFTSGGGFNRILEELIESGFVAKTLPHGKKNKDALYYVLDSFSIFYNKFLKNIRIGKETWLKQMNSQTYITWSGFAFERLIMQHTSAIKKALEIGGIYTEESSWIGEYNNEKAQIDLLIDRADNTVTICEAKFYNQKFALTKKIAADWKRKIEIFSNQSKTRKNITFCVISTFGITENEYSIGLVQSQLNLNDLFID